MTGVCSLLDAVEDVYRVCGDRRYLLTEDVDGLRRMMLHRSCLGGMIFNISKVLYEFFCRTAIFCRLCRGIASRFKTM